MLTLTTIELRHENDTLLARQRVRDITEILGMSPQDQTRFATSVSELVRNAWNYAGGGRVELGLDVDPPRSLVARVVDKGPGIKDLERVLSGRYQSPTGMGLGLIGSRRLMDTFDVQTGPSGTTVTVGKTLPPGAGTRPAAEWARTISAELAVRRPSDPLMDARERNRELLQTLAQLQTRELQLEEANRKLEQANQELEDTNRGVVALYAELDARAEFARRASELKTRFLSHLSHEFRTPLGSVLSLTDLLLARLDGPLNPEQETQVRLIRKSTSTLSELVEDLLDIARLEAGTTQLRVSEFTVAELFNALRGMVRPLLVNPDVDLIFESENLPPLRTDEGKVSQVLRNLVSNSLKFTERGEIRVKAAQGPDGLIIFTVSDTGLGISAKDRERIFEEFVQVENRLQKNFKGTGLGLPLSRKLAEVLGGSLTVESEEGKGSTFYLAVKDNVGQGTKTVPSGDVHLPSGEGRRLLLGDDHAATRYLLTAQLRAAGYEVQEAKSGDEVLELVRANPPDGLLLDLAMPGKSGYDVLGALMADERTRTLPVIIYTSSTLTDAERAKLTHAVAIVGKPEAKPQEFMVDLSEALLRARVFRREDRRG
ncbi:MAG: ATP-binding protein [Myxococcaceae bacterium]